MRILILAVLLVASSANGQHWFSAPLALDPSMRTQAAVDVDGDGDLDLIRVGLDAAGNWISAATWINDGSGGFQGGLGGPLPSGLTKLVITGDFNGDGFQDVAVPTSTTTPGLGAGILVFRGNGTGSFPAATHTALDGNVLAWSAADVNGDGLTDLTVTNLAAGALGTRVRWLLGTSASTFAPQSGQLFPQGLQLEDLALLDIDGDGDLDLLTVLAGAGPQVAALLTTGTSLGFGIPIANLPLTGTAPQLEAGDFLGNGAPQVIAVARSGGSLEIMLVTFPGGTTIATSPALILPLGLMLDGLLSKVDWNADGSDDLLYRAPLVSPGNSDSLLVLGNGVTSGFAFTFALPFPNATNPGAPIGDFDGDGNVDVAGAWDVVFGDGTLDHPLPGVPGTLASVAALDWDGDGDPDLVSNSFTVQINDGTGRFTPTPLILPALPPDQSYGAMAFGDLNGDGYQDILASLVVQQPFMGIFTYLDNRLLTVGGGGVLVDLGSASPNPTQFLLRLETHAPAIDIDGDGDLDLLETGSTFIPGKPWLNNGSGFFVPSPQSYGTWTPWHGGDIDGDGDMDLVATTSTQVGVLLQQAGGGWTQMPLGSLTGSPGIPTLADFDDDGDLDVAVIAASSSLGGQVYVSENLGGNTFAQHVLPGFGIYGSTSRVLATDVDGDGRTDLVLTGSSFTIGSLCVSCEIIVRRRLGPGFTNLAPPVNVRGTIPTLVADVDGDGDEDLIGPARITSRRFFGASAGSRVQFGPATLGSAGFFPLLGASGPFRPGAVADIHVTRALAGAMGMMVFGSSTSSISNSPLPGLTSYCEPWAGFFPIATTPATPAPGLGRLTLSVVLPPTLAGMSVCLQAGIFDPVGLSGVAITNGLSLQIGL